MGLVDCKWEVLVVVEPLAGCKWEGLAGVGCKWEGLVEVVYKWEGLAEVELLVGCELEGLEVGYNF